MIIITNSRRSTEGRTLFKLVVVILSTSFANKNLKGGGRRALFLKWGTYLLLGPRADALFFIGWRMLIAAWVL